MVECRIYKITERYKVNRINVNGFNDLATNLIMTNELPLDAYNAGVSTEIFGLQEGEMDRAIRS